MNIPHSKKQNSGSHTKPRKYHKRGNRRIKFEGCSHFGRGKYCHRCDQGLALKEATTKEKHPKKAEEMLEEGNRLLGRT